MSKPADAMAIRRSGPPTTHDCVTWRVPLSGAPSVEWEQAFRAADESTAVARARGVQFEPAALTFRSSEDDVPAWVERIDAWIAGANQARADTGAARRREAARTEQQSDARRQKVNEANDKFRDL
jgi:hypothetical protein